MKRKNTRRFDPRYFMDEKTEKVPIKENRFTSAELSRFALSPAMEPSVAPPEMVPEKRLEWLNYQIDTTTIPTQKARWEAEREKLIANNPELRDRGEGPMAEGLGDVGMHRLGPAQMLDSALVLLDNEPDERDIAEAIAILVKLQAHIS